MKNTEFSSLKQIARKSLTANIVTTTEGSYLAAGSHQFGSLWTRDFCFAVRGLLAIGRDDVARHHLGHLIRERRRNDGLIPRMLESVPSWKRVLAHTAFRFLPETLKTFPIQAPLKAEHLGEHGTISIDSNALVLRAVADLERRAPDRAWLDENRQGLQEILDFCLARTNNAQKLVEQGRFEDWQDSVAREGRTLFVNAMFALAFESAHELGLRLPTISVRFANLLEPAFFEPTSGVFRSHAELPLISIDGNLLMINEDALTRTAHAGRALYPKLKAHSIWSKAGLPGAASEPDYPSSWVSWTTRVVGLRHYHDRLLWSWLSGLSAKAAAKCGDTVEAERIFGRLQSMAERDGAIAEIYTSQSGPSGLNPVRTPFYISEMPFSWGSGCILEALETFEAL